MNIPDKFTLSYGCLSKPISEQLKEQEEALKDSGYELYEKPAVKAVKTFYEKNTIG